MLRNRPVFLVVTVAGLALGLTLGCPSVDLTGGGSSGGGPSGGGSFGGGSSGGGSGGGSSGGGSSGGGGSEGSAGFPLAPRSPVPSDGARNVAVDFWSRVDWAPVAPSYDVYFGTDPTPDSGEFLQTTNTSETDNWLDLQYDTTYYWQVVSIDGSRSTDGPVWSFRTESNPSGGGGSGGGGSSGACGDNPFFADDRVQADAGPNLTIDPGMCISLNGRITNGHAPFTVAWTSPGWSFPSDETEVIACPEETGTFTFTVLDSCGVQDMDPMTVTVRSNSGGGGGGGGGQQTSFEPGTYQGLVVQDTEVFSGGVLIDTFSLSSSQSITINSQGRLNFNVGDTVVRWGLSTEVTSISVSDSGDIIRLFYDAHGTVEGVSMSGSGSEFYTWLSSSDSILFSGSVSVHTTNQTPQLEQESTVHSTFVKW